MVQDRCYPTLGYWSIRGLAEPIRYLLHFTDTSYEEKQYDILGESPSYSKKQWYPDRDSLGLEFPNLPYLVDGPLKITESWAILRHIGRATSLAGGDEQEWTRLDMAQGVLTDMTRAFGDLCYSPQFASLKESYLESFEEVKMKRLTQLLSRGAFILGDKISFADFVLFELLEQHLALEGNCLNKFSVLKAFHERVNSLPAIRKYMSSPGRHKIEEKFNGKMAFFGSGN